MKRIPLLVAAMALATAIPSPGPDAMPAGRVAPPPPNRPPLREDTYTAKRKAKARAKRGW